MKNKGTEDGAIEIVSIPSKGFTELYSNFGFMHVN